MIDDRELDKGVRMMQVIWVSMILSVAIYVFVIPRLLAGEVRVPGSLEQFASLRAALYVASFGALLLAWFFRRRILAGKFSSASGSSIATHPVIQRYSTAMVVSLALSEAVAIFGLVLFFIAGDTGSLYLLGAVSALSMLAHRPRRQEIVDAALGAG